MTPTLTPWFPPEVKPVRVGWYVATLWPKYHPAPALHQFRRYWNGERFSIAVHHKDSPFGCSLAMHHTDHYAPYVYWSGSTVEIT